MWYMICVKWSMYMESVQDEGVEDWGIAEQKEESNKMH